MAVSIRVFIAYVVGRCSSGLQLTSNDGGFPALGNALE